MSGILKTTARLLRSSAFRYGMFGMLFGFSFPIIGTIIKLVYSQLPIDPVNFMHIQRTDPILWIVDTAPLFLGIFAAFAGSQNDILKQVNEKLILREKELEGTQNTLEERIATRTAELQEANQQIEKRVVRLQVISNVSQEISSNVGLGANELLTRIAESISEKIGFYHVGIFLMGENQEYAVLRASNSKGGQQMLARHHQLKVGGTGIVGYVAQSGHPRIALDTGADAVFFNNPDLPETRSEMALPLKYGNTVIGVLDVQSTLSSAFSNEDINTLNTLANQIAIIIRNLQIAEGEGFVYSPQGGKRAVQFSRNEQQSGYSFRPDGTITSSTLPRENPALEKAIASNETVILSQPSIGVFPTLAVPVKFRDEIIGVIHIEASEANRVWTEDEVAMVQAISERAALALENARLFEDATRRAEQEETISRVTTQIGASTDFNRILQTTIQELGQALGASRSFIQLSAPSDGNEITHES
jgi:GAF domain-containing protein